MNVVREDKRGIRGRLSSPPTTPPIYPKQELACRLRLFAIKVWGAAVARGCAARGAGFGRVAQGVSKVHMPQAHISGGLEPAESRGHGQKSLLA